MKNNHCVNTSKINISNDMHECICKEFIAFDTETTGLSPKKDHIIEVGAVRFVNGEIVERYGSLINAGVEVPYGAYRVNGISTQMLQEQGEDPEVVYANLVEFFGDALNCDIFICGHNASFDMNFLKKALEEYGYSGDIHYIDTLSFSKQVVKGLPNYKQETLAKHFHVRNRHAHRAVEDAETCGKILLELIKVKEAM